MEVLAFNTEKGEFPVRQAVADTEVAEKVTGAPEKGLFTFLIRVVF